MFSISSEPPTAKDFHNPPTESSNRTMPLSHRVHFDIDDNGKPLSDRKLRGLSRCEWIAFNLKCFVKSLGRIFTWASVIITVTRKSCSNVEKIQKIRLMGGLMAKILQSVGSNDALIRSIFNPDNDNEFNKIKLELNKIMHDNTGMTIPKIIKLLDSSCLDYDKSRMSEIAILGAGTVASVVSVPMADGTTKAVKIVDSNLEIQFLSDISIFKKLMYLVSTIKPKLFGPGARKALEGLCKTIIKEFDLRYEAEDTITHKRVIENIRNGKNNFDITEKNSCLCVSEQHGLQADECREYLNNAPESPARKMYLAPYDQPFGEKHSIDVDFKTTDVFEQQSARNIMVMGKINGIPLSSSPNDIRDHIIIPLFKGPNNDTVPVPKDYVNNFIDNVKELSYIVWEKGLYNEGHGSADMHNGNTMLAVKDGRLEIYSIDFGSYVSLSRATTVAIYTIIGLINNLLYDVTKFDEFDIKVLVDSLSNIGMPFNEAMDVDRSSIEKSIASELLSTFDGSISFIACIFKVFDIAFKHNLYMPPPILSYFRTKGLIHLG